MSGMELGLGTVHAAQDWQPKIDRDRTAASPTAHIAAARGTSLLGTGRGRFHPSAQTERPHVGPYLFNVLKALRPAALLSHRTPTGRYLFVQRPDRVLLLGIDNNEIGSRVVLIVGWHALISI